MTRRTSPRRTPPHSSSSCSVNPWPSAGSTGKRAVLDGKQHLRGVVWIYLFPLCPVSWLPPPPPKKQPKTRARCHCEPYKTPADPQDGVCVAGSHTSTRSLKRQTRRVQWRRNTRHVLVRRASAWKFSRSLTCLRIWVSLCLCLENSSEAVRPSPQTSGSPTLSHLGCIFSQTLESGNTRATDPRAYKQRRRLRRFVCFINTNICVSL